MTKIRTYILLLLALFFSLNMYANSEKFTFSGGSTTTTKYRTLSKVKVGDFITENTIPKRLYIDGGYIDIDFNSGTTYYYYYIHDNQGSVRAVVDEEGELKQSVDYTAYGVPSTRYMMNDDNRMHLSLEWQTLKGWNTYLNNARTRDPHYARFQQLDPLAEKYYPFSPYHYGACNPLKYTDPTGKVLETGWDIFNITTGAASFTGNILAGNYIGAVVDGIGLVADVAAAIVPGVPGGAGTAIKAVRTADNLTDATSATKHVTKIVHGNSKASVKAQHAYDIIDTETGNRVKTGVSGGKVRKDGKSYRAEQQVRKQNKKAGKEQYKSEIVHTESAGEGARDKILEYERQRAGELWKNNEIDTNIHKRP